MEFIPFTFNVITDVAVFKSTMVIFVFYSIPFIFLSSFRLNVLESHFSFLFLKLYFYSGCFRVYSIYIFFSFLSFFFLSVTDRTQSPVSAMQALYCWAINFPQSIFRLPIPVPMQYKKLTAVYSHSHSQPLCYCYYAFSFYIY